MRNKKVRSKHNNLLNYFLYDDSELSLAYVKSCKKFFKEIIRKDKMLIKEANKIIISLSKPDKMPGFAYGLPAWECKTGAKLAKVPGSVCSGCYAMKGNYTRFPEIKRAQYKRLAAIRHPLWVQAMTAKINSEAVSKHKYFRWHDAGDVQDLRHLAKIFEVCRRTSQVKHWMPTREAWTKKMD
jgi:hypothetical protein